MKICGYFFLLLVYSTNLYSQHINSKWLFGYSSGGGSGFGGTDIDFNSQPPTISYHFRNMNIDQESTAICDPAGNLLFYTNGVYIANSTDQPMLNGSGLAPGQFTTTYANFGLPISQGALAIPEPGSINKYLLFHVTGSYLQQGYVQPLELFYTEIDMTLDGGLGGVVSKNNILISDTLAMGGINAVKHANGRDWWIIIPEWNSNGYYTLLVSPYGIDGPFKQNIGFACGLFDWSGQTVFSPDGNHFARYDNDNELNIFDFDRCSGMLSNSTHISIADSAVAGGVAFSPNSQFLYVTSTYDIYQFDMNAIPISSSQITVAHWDGFASPFATTFFLCALAPDGRIYINSTNGENVLGRIESPDSAGISCDVHQHSVQLVTFNSNSIPNFPNYLLGAEIGSVCDSLTSINQSELANSQVSISPNPAADFINILFSTPTKSSGKIRILDSHSKPVNSYTITNGISSYYIDVESFSSGLYIVEFQFDNIIFQKKFIKLL